VAPIANPQSAIHNPQSMKILLLTWDYPPARGGIQTWMCELARRLPDADVTVLAPAMPGDRAFDVESGCRVQRIAGARTGRWAWQSSLGVAALRRSVAWRPDLIVCGHVITAPAALFVHWLLGIPYIVFAYGYEIRRKRWRRLASALLRRAGMVVACSAFSESAVLALGVPPARVRVLYPGVDPQRFAPTPDGTGQRAGLAAGTILSVSRLNDLYKGHDTVIRALPLVRAKCPNARFLIGGDGPLRDYLTRIAQSVGMGEHVEFLGEVSDDALPDLYRSADVLVQLSRESSSEGGAEGFGIVCLEAAACGKPVVAGWSGGLVEAVQDGVTGTLVDSLDLGAAAEAIVSVLEDPALARRLGRAGRERVLARFTWSHMALEARRIFADVAGIP
jgi:phosphatidylinositol alpha-1,6-mannosyltransferase